MTRSLLAIIALAVVAAILWVDVATGLWQDYVILSGLAAGLVTFVLTAMVVDRVVARSEHKRWEPVTHLALTDILHAIADEDGSEIARGIVEPSLLDPLAAVAGEPPIAALESLAADVVDERVRLTEALARWTSFLAASADAEAILQHSALLAERLDVIRDLAVEMRGGEGSTAESAALNDQINTYNSSVRQLVAELQRVIRASKQLRVGRP